MKGNFQITLTDDGRGHVATCDQYPEFTCTAPGPVAALAGLIRIINESKKGT
jgi:hypothetical protein